jgi:hypothetical protein
MALRWTRVAGRLCVRRWGMLKTLWYYWDTAPRRSIMRQRHCGWRSVLWAKSQATLTLNSCSIACFHGFVSGNSQPPAWLPMVSRETRQVGPVALVLVDLVIAFALQVLNWPLFRVTRPDPLVGMTSWRCDASIRFFQNKL